MISRPRARYVARRGGARLGRGRLVCPQARPLAGPLPRRQRWRFAGQLSSAQGAAVTAASADRCPLDQDEPQWTAARLRARPTVPVTGHRARCPAAARWLHRPPPDGARGPGCRPQAARHVHRLDRWPRPGAVPRRDLRQFGRRGAGRVRAARIEVLLASLTARPRSSTTAAASRSTSSRRPACPASSWS